MKVIDKFVNEEGVEIAVVQDRQDIYICDADTVELVDVKASKKKYGKTVILYEGDDEEYHEPEVGDVVELQEWFISMSKKELRRVCKAAKVKT